MASAEAGPSFAPDDPTLPNPWKGLIDGSTGVLYYWNPETNVTQYEKPVIPTLPPSAPPPACPVSSPLGQAALNGSFPQQHIAQTYQPPWPIQQWQQPPLQNQQFMHSFQNQYSQIQHPSYQQNPYMPRAQGQFAFQPGHQAQAFQFPYQQAPPFTGPKSDSQAGYPPEKQPLNDPLPISDQGQIKQVHLETKLMASSPSNGHGQVQQGANVYQSQHGGPPPMSQSQHGGPPPMSQSQQASVETSHLHRQTASSAFLNKMGGHSMGQSSLGSKPSFEEDYHERGGNEFYSSNRPDGPMIHAAQPKLAPLPLAQRKQDTRSSAIPPTFHPPGNQSRSGMPPGHSMPGIYSHGAFPITTTARPPPRMIEAPPDSPNISVEAYRQRHELTAMGDNIPAPFMTFESTGFPPEILREIHAAGFLYPTPIQAQTWSIALQNRDIVAIAKTGSGKTLGYLIPAFIHLSRCRNNSQFGPTVLILSPTRELATQIQDEAIKFGRSSRITCTCLYGGAPKGPQLKEVERGVDIVVATPGRLNDILEMGKISFRQISFLVLDEADRMLDMGFELQIRKIVNEIPPRRQTLMYTATWPMEVRKIAGDLLSDSVQVNIGNVDELVANKSITQYVEVLSPMDKQRRLEQIIRSQERGSKVLIFCSTKRLCDQLARSISRPFGAIAIHGDKSQAERDQVLSQFRTGRFPVLVATDVAARGLDIKDIRVVINYDFPTGIEDYVHRIGRTGRAGATGLSYTFFTEQDWKHAAELIKLLEGANQAVPPEIREMAVRSGPPPHRFVPHAGTNRWDSGGANGAPRMDSGVGRGVKEFGGRGGGRGFGGRGGGRSDFHADGRGGGRSDFHADGRGGGRSDFHADGRRGGRSDFRVDGRRGFGRGGYDRGNPRDRFQNSEGRGFNRIRDRSYSRSPERGRTRRHGRSRSRSSGSSRSWSRSRSRSWSSRSRSRSRSKDKYDQRPVISGGLPAVPEPRRRRVSGFDAPPLPQVAAAGIQAPLSSSISAANGAVSGAPEIGLPPETGL